MAYFIYLCAGWRKGIMMPSWQKLMQTILLTSGLLLLSASPSWPAQFSTKYDEDIRLAVKHWWPDRPFWKEWKAQLYQESRLDPTVCSSVGACGLAQFMPKSWDDITKQIGIRGANPHDARPAIEAGAYYMAQLRHSWSSNRPADDRQELAQASYNAGLGNILKAQKLCNEAVLYKDIISCLPHVTGTEFSNQTTTYVKRITEYWRQLELMK